MTSIEGDYDVPGNPAGYIVGKINDGASATEALNDFRDAGGSMRTQTWYRLYGEVTDQMARYGSYADLPDNMLPDPNLYATWSMGQGGEYASQVSVYFRDKDTGLVGVTHYTYKSDLPHTPGEAKQAALDEYGDSETESSYDQAVVGASIDTMYQTVAFQ